MSVSFTPIDYQRPAVDSRQRKLAGKRPARKPLKTGGFCEEIFFGWKVAGKSAGFHCVNKMLNIAESIEVSRLIWPSVWYFGPFAVVGRATPLAKLLSQSLLLVVGESKAFSDG